MGDPRRFRVSYSREECENIKIPGEHVGREISECQYPGVEMYFYPRGQQWPMRRKDLASNPEKKGPVIQEFSSSSDALSNTSGSTSASNSTPAEISTVAVEISFPDDHEDDVLFRVRVCDQEWTPWVHKKWWGYDSKPLDAIAVEDLWAKDINIDVEFAA